ncbi:MAG: hypothetical protein JXB39_08295 [Deltaproteobacteria bacterium]|nr:hypothetical protein [Deltaproteobacteria bacterium]
MSLSGALDAALGAPGGVPGRVRAEADGVLVDADVVDADRLGATLDRVVVRDPGGGSVARQAEAAPERLKALGEPIAPVEVEPRLGGAVLRTLPEAMEKGRFWEVTIGADGREAAVGRYRVEADGARRAEPFTVTREALGRVVDGLADALGAGRTEETG